jgi:hypothetical protein
MSLEGIENRLILPKSNHTDSECCTLMQYHGRGAMGRSRPAKFSVRLTTSVSAELAQKLDSVARAQKVSKSWAIARALEAYVENPALGFKTVALRGGRRNPSV